MLLRIGVLIYDNSLSTSVFQCLADKEKSNGVYPVKVSNTMMIMNDGTVYETISDSWSFRSKRFDQIFIIEDSRWDTLHEANIIQELQLNLCASCVPEEFLIQKFDIKKVKCYNTFIK